ncbi:hypothetical protein AVEN_164058-1 [Araneus ventricosus]|uniref:Uncharacterized protein n=1 Tax=Araneus ventricosus TaxID=182803 RepID=A0A4Y2FYF8_ARAVE|nr:hypothetical protein AVEN_164058-1 [Araneus ventricosus]
MLKTVVCSTWNTTNGDTILKKQHTGILPIETQSLEKQHAGIIPIETQSLGKQHAGILLIETPSLEKQHAGILPIETQSLEKQHAGILLIETQSLEEQHAGILPIETQSLKKQHATCLRRSFYGYIQTIPSTVESIKRNTKRKSAQTLESSTLEVMGYPVWNTSTSSPLSNHATFF